MDYKDQAAWVQSSHLILKSLHSVEKDLVTEIQDAEIDTELGTPNQKHKDNWLGLHPLLHSTVGNIMHLYWMQHKLNSRNIYNLWSMF